MAKTHLRANAVATLCGMQIEAVEWNGGALPIAADLAALHEVKPRLRCRQCIKTAARAIPAALLSAARKARDAIASGEEEAPYVAPPPEPARYGARELTRTARRALADAGKVHERPERQWPSASAAIRSYVQSRAEGASLRSTTDPDRANRVQHSRDPSLGGREHAAVDRHATVARALSEAMAAPGLDVLSPLAADDALDAALMVVVGKGQREACRALGGEERKGRDHMRWIGKLPEDVALEMAERTGVALHGAHVEALVRHFVGAVSDALLASGEMQGREERPRRVWDPAARIREAMG